jgi:hypothetical protein
LAISSSEPADIVATATLASCVSEKKAAVDVIEQHSSGSGFATVRAFEQEFTKAIVLEIIQARTQRPSLPDTETGGQRTPI